MSSEEPYSSMFRNLLRIYIQKDRREDAMG